MTQGDLIFIGMVFIIMCFILGAAFFYTDFREDNKDDDDSLDS